MSDSVDVKSQQRLFNIEKNKEQKKGKKHNEDFALLMNFILVVLLKQDIDKSD